MPAFLCFNGGSNNGKKIQIEKELLRIGTDRECEIQLSDQGIAPRVAVIEFRNGKYLFHNRSDRQVLLAGKTITPRSPGVTWSHDESVQIAPNVHVTLEIEGDPQPSKRTELVDWRKEGIDVPQTAPAKPPRKLLSLTNMLILCYVLLIPVMLVVGLQILNPKTTYDPQWSIEYEKVIRELIKQEKNNHTVRSYREHLQAAREAELRGYPNTANSLYSDLINNLQDVRIRDSSSQTGNNSHQELFTTMMGLARAKLSPQKSQ